MVTGVVFSWKYGINRRGQVRQRVAKQLCDSTDRYSMVWGQHGSTATQVLASLHSQPGSADLTLVTEDGEAVPGHRAVLSAASSFLARWVN